MNYSWIINCIFIVFSCGLQLGCASNTTKLAQDYLQADYIAVIEDAENSNTDTSNISAIMHAMICDSYLQLRQFNEFDNCIDSVVNSGINAEELRNSLIDSLDPINQIDFGGGYANNSGQKVDDERNNDSVYRSFKLNASRACFCFGGC
ncbi:hypothetical protein [Psychromonas sp. MME2]|uniref:hypothetical protein n=1 Tax=Psychromonas sp. MME2 TaxID=3231033 RepID=UPI00339C0BCD